MDYGSSCRITAIPFKFRPMDVIPKNLDKEFTTANMGLQS